MEPQTELDDDTLSKIDSVYHEIQAIYDAGIPVFTKDSIRKVGEEGERNNGANITFKGINGVDYELFIKPPISKRRENEHVGGSTWIITYNSIMCLTNRENIEFFNFQNAYLPMWICAPIRLLGQAPEFEHPPTPPEDDFNLYQAFEQQWKTSQHFEQVQEVLASIKIPFTVTKVIGLSLGPLVFKSRMFKRRVFQHALVSVLRQKLSISLNPFVQDPSYTQRDRDILYSAGLTVLEDPQALLELDESSILVAICAGLPVKDIVVDTCRPGIIIWDNEGPPDIRSLSHSLRVKKMIENEYSGVAFPNHDAFRNLVMLIRKST
ncbi:hypothetical protein F4859DRAFT_507814 [Xylaria cf. heliscus]|nr:hypothetical protein F4859DRAFT_507814 [Xylaria cf. heliscus]